METLRFRAMLLQSVCAAALLSVLCPSARGEGKDASFVIVIGNNQSLEADLARLRYADDDAVRYFELFSQSSAEVRLLTVMDEETQVRHAELVRGAGAPTIGNLKRELDDVYERLRAQKRLGQRTALTLVFIGHGGVDERAAGYLHMLDGRLTRDELFSLVIAGSPADTTHLIVDACHAYTLLAGRGEGESEENRAFAEYLTGNELERYPTVGVLLAGAKDQKTHEWSEIEAGLFSHQVRSALSGAADVNQDGKIEYSEVAAFVDAANAKLPFREARMRTLAWPPQQNRHAPIWDLTALVGSRLLVLGAEIEGRIAVENDLAERWVDLNKPRGAQVVLAVPDVRAFFVRRGEREWAIAPGRGVALVDDMGTPARLAARGAVDRSFGQHLFAVPFDASYYRGYLSGHPELLGVDETASPAFGGQLRAKNRGPLEIGAGYGLGGFLLGPLDLGSAKGHLEHSGFALLALYLHRLIGLTARLELGGSAVDDSPASKILRGAALVGAVGNFSIKGPLSAEVGLEAGWGAVKVSAKSLSSHDYSLWTGRARAGLRVEVGKGLSITAQGTATVALVSLDQGEEATWRPGLELGVAWRPGR